MKHRNFRLCFAAALSPPGFVNPSSRGTSAFIHRVAGWVAFRDGSWWVKRHVCEDASEPAPWVQAKTRSGCVRYLARAVLLDLKHDPTDGANTPEWPKTVKERAELALKLGGRVFGREAQRC